MATSILNKITARLKLENGYDEAGNLRTVNQSIGDLSESYFQSNQADALAKLWAIRTTLGACLSKTVSSLETVATSVVTNA